MTNKICVYAICKNEEAFVDRWVDSMQEADSIVVLDTGSTDNTVEKLKARGVNVTVKEIKPWRFDVARNESLKLVPEDCNILVCADLDEIFEKGWADVLRKSWIEGVHTRAEYRYVWSHAKDGSNGREFLYNKIHDKNWKWKYPVHELLANNITDSENYLRENALNLFNSITLHHYPDMTKSRASYLMLLELREKESPEDYYGLIYLAQEYYYRGFYNKSIEKFEKCLENSPADAILEKASCYLFLGDDYVQKHDYKKAIENYTQANYIEPTYREPYINLAKVYIIVKRYAEAIECLKLAVKNTYRHYSWLERDTSWTYNIYDLLSQAYYYNGQKALSLSCAYKAFLCCPADSRLKDNISIIVNSMSETDYLG